MPKPKAGPWLVVVGLNVRDAAGAEQRYEPSQMVTDLPASSVGWLLEQGAIVPIAAEPKE